MTTSRKPPPPPPPLLQGDVLAPGQIAEATGRFVPSDEGGLAFIKLAGDRGWVPMSPAFGVVPAGLC